MTDRAPRPIELTDPSTGGTVSVPADQVPVFEGRGYRKVQPKRTTKK